MKDMHFWEFTGQREDDKITHMPDTVQKGNNFTMEAWGHFTALCISTSSSWTPKRKSLWSLFFSLLLSWFDSVSFWVNHLLRAALLDNPFHTPFRIPTTKQTHLNPQPFPRMLSHLHAWISPRMPLPFPIKVKAAHFPSAAEPPSQGRKEGLAILKLPNGPQFPHIHSFLTHSVLSTSSVSDAQEGPSPSIQTALFKG